MVDTTQLFSTEHFAEAFRKKLVEDLLSAAQPILEEAVEKARVEMRKRLAVKVVGLIDQSYQLERDGINLRITVKLAAPSVGHDLGGSYER